MAIVALLSSACCHRVDPALEAAQEVIARAVGNTDNIELAIVDQVDGKDCYEVTAADGRLSIQGSSPVAICYAFNTYLHEACESQITWSGSHLQIPEQWPDYQASKQSPYELRYFLNVCTFGYTSPYWDWERWSEELDWMALHGVNFPLASVASESIARRVWLKLGLTEEEVDSFFTGPAHLPWHRMGNLNSYDGPLCEQWHKDQVVLQHKILEKMRALGMHPVAPAFAGFVPPAFMQKHPEAHARQLTWGGFDTACNACVLSPDSPFFAKIGKMFIEEWEKEFGEAKYFLSDSFNEMKLPVDPADTAAKHDLLRQYGKAIYSSIAAGNPDAVWVTQGWTFGYQHDFWDQESLAALLSEVPDDKMIIIDLGNDYPKWVWHTEQTWKVHEGFYGKNWIYSYVPNFGGKVLPTGDLAMYASGSAEALASPFSEHLIGFGSAPEGLENNEVVYELLADMGWTSDSIDLDSWLECYCKARYGYCDENMTEAWKLMCSSVYSSLYSYPRFTWQTVVPDQRRHSRHDINEDFFNAVELFISCADSCKNSELYVNDLVEFTSFCLSEVADRYYTKAVSAWDRGDKKTASALLEKTVCLLGKTDKLLASHPNHRLSDWVGYAQKSSTDPDIANSYSANAKRLITTWGGWQEDYAARLWSGLISDYYIPRIEMYLSDKRSEIDTWEEKWINTVYKDEIVPFEDPVAASIRLFREHK